MFLFIAAVAATGIIPQIFQQTQQLNVINQSLVNQYEDEARERQTAHQDEVIRAESRAVLTNLTNSTKIIVSDMFGQFTNYIDRTNNTTNKIIQGLESSIGNQKQILLDLDNNTGQNNQILKVLNKRGLDHEIQTNLTREMMNLVDNTTSANLNTSQLNQKKLDILLKYFNLTDNYSNR